MTDATLIDGKAIAKTFRKAIKEQIASMPFKPGLSVVLVGDNPASQIYVRNKQKTADRLGMNSFLHVLPKESDEDKILKLINGLNQDQTVHGILVQLPLPEHLNAHNIISAISPAKDIDGLHPLNIGKLSLGTPNFIPCTPLGCLHLIKSVQQNLTGLNAVVVGCSNLVGRPMAQLLINEGCTVSLAHSKTKNLPELCKTADILVVAAGAPKLITSDFVKNGAILIDVGITKMADDTISGDVDFEDVIANKAVHISPVPGGVGPMTIAMLMENTLKAASQLTSTV